MFQPVRKDEVIIMKLESKDRGFSLQLRLKRGNLIAAGVLLAASAVMFALNPQLFFGGPSEEAQPFQPGDTALYLLLTLLPCALCLIEVKLPQVLKKIAGWLMLLVLPLLSFQAVDNINHTQIADFDFKTSLANYIGYLMVFALLFAVCRRVWVTALLGGAVFLTFGIANYFTSEFRGAPILPWDLSSVGTAFSVAGGYTYELTKPIAVSILLYLLAVLFCYHVCPRGKENTSRRGRMTERAGALAIAGALFLLIFPADVLTDLGISVWAWNQKTSSKLTGVTAGFFANIQFLMVDKPEGYSAAKVKQLEAEIEELPEPAALGSPEGLPTIIAVMNESMTDFTRTGKGSLTLTSDNLPFLHSLQESGDVIWGTAYSSVYGGNTCNSEYEFLTSNTLSFLPTGSKPYQQYVDHDQSSLVSILKEYGYDCTAIHPGQRSAWQRDTAYPYLGFDKFIDVDAFTVNRTFEHRLTSDRSSYDQVIAEYENRGDDPLFLFNVTIQNHGGYEDENFRTTVQVAEAAGEFPQAEQYLSLTKKSDQALEELIGYFSQQEDPVVILFFGDHWPNLESGFLTQLLGQDSDRLSFENIMREYEVPFLIWANYPLEGQEIKQISLNYLSGLLLRSAGLQGTGYTKFVEQVRQVFPVITANGMIDREGIYYKIGESTPYDDLLNEYAMLQYNNAFGLEGKAEGLFSIG